MPQPLPVVSPSRALCAVNGDLLHPDCCRAFDNEAAVPTKAPEGCVLHDVPEDVLDKGFLDWLIVDADAAAALVPP